MKNYLLPLLGLTLIAPTVSVLNAAPAHAQAKTSVKIRLTGARIGALRPEGSSEYRVDAARNRRSFRVEANKVSLPDGTVLTVSVNGVPVGAITLLLGAGRLDFATERGDSVPTMAAGAVVTVTTSAGATVLSGRF